VVAGQRGIGRHRLDHLEPALWTEGHADRDGAVELDHR
jgi:hypothetical protein